MSLNSLYRPSNINASYTDVYCHCLYTHCLSFDGVNIQTSLSPNYLEANRNTDFTVPDAVRTVVTGYDDKNGNLSSDFDSTTGVWTIANNGHYCITANIHWTSDSSGYRQLDILLNGSEICGTASPGIADRSGQSCSINKFLSAGDTLSIQVVANTINPSVDLDECHLNVVQVGIN